MYGVILAGGEGTRLRPLTNATNKHLLPIGKQPMIYYPLDCFVAAGIKDVVIVTGGKHAEDFTECISKEDKYIDLNISYVYQNSPDGIVGALKLVEPFVKYERFAPGADKFIVMLGDNIIEPHEFTRIYNSWFETRKYKALLVSTFSSEPENYGVIEYNKKRKFIDRIVEKPKHTQSTEIATGIYGFKSDVFERIPDIKKSKRGEYEITEILNTYILEDCVLVERIEGMWNDCGESIDAYNRICWQKSKYGRNCND